MLYIFGKVDYATICKLYFTYTNIFCSLDSTKCFCEMRGNRIMKSLLANVILYKIGTVYFNSLLHFFPFLTCMVMKKHSMLLETVLKCFRNHVHGPTLLISPECSDFISSFSVCSKMTWQKARVVAKELTFCCFQDFGQSCEFRAWVEETHKLQHFSHYQPMVD